jgi:hypothetical protein
MKAANRIIIAGLLALSCGSTFAETASELRRSPQYQEHERAVAILDNAPAEIHSCVWSRTFGHTWTVDEAKSRIAECQRIRNDYLLEQAIRDGVPVIAVVISLALAIGFRKRIAARIYNLFVGILAFGILYKRFLDHAIKEAADRSVEKKPPPKPN